MNLLNRHSKAKSLSKLKKLILYQHQRQTFLHAWHFDFSHSLNSSKNRITPLRYKFNLNPQPSLTLLVQGKRQSITRCQRSTSSKFRRSVPNLLSQQRKRVQTQGPGTREVLGWSFKD